MSEAGKDGIRMQKDSAEGREAVSHVENRIGRFRGKKHAQRHERIMGGPVGLSALF